ncbi:lipase family protein [Roseibium sp.]|uniref:lipase family protein n=1 Tax=Roseibium sp. TaxID=1936156 RepID=UPI003BA8C93A
MNQYQQHPLDLFDPHRKGYKAVNGWAMAWASNLAYKSEVQIKGAFDGFSQMDDCKIEYFEDKRSGAEAYAISTRTFILIAIRGTNDLTDIRYDSRAWLQKFESGGSVHHGFLEQLDAIWEKLACFVRRETDQIENKKLWITGHSLGGAIAVLAATRFLDEKSCSFKDQFEFGHLYTFGQPRVGNKEFVNYAKPLLKGKYHRGTKANDMVANALPPNLVYKHFGAEWYVKRSGKINPSVRLTTKSWDRRAGQLAFIINLLPNLVFKRVIEIFYDHRLDKYEQHFFDSYQNALKRQGGRKHAR